MLKEIAVRWQHDISAASKNDSSPLAPQEG